MPRDSDTRRMAETGTGSVRSTGSAGRNGIAQFEVSVRTALLSKEGESADA